MTSWTDDWRITSLIDDLDEVGQNSGGWLCCATADNDHFIEIDLGNAHCVQGNATTGCELVVYGLVTQGRSWNALLE